MGKLYFHYSTMNAGKSTALLQANHNYIERGMKTHLLTAKLDDRAGSVGQIHSRIGITQPAEVFGGGTDLFALLAALSAREEIACVFVDEAQFLSKQQVWQLARAVDDLGLPVMAYGLRVDFQGELFAGSAALLALADELREVRTICHCGKKATMVIRQGPGGRALLEGEQVQVGGNEVYVSLCRKHFRSATGDRDGCDLGLPLPSGREPKMPTEELPRHLSLGLPLPPLTPVPLMPVAAPEGGVATRDSDRESPS
jgi:thymidine kinase